MSLKHGLLGLLNYGNMTGYELNKNFEESLGFFWQAQTSQIYRELISMEKIGWLTSNIVVQADKPNKRIYEITLSGKDELKKWLIEVPLSSRFNNRNTFIMKTFFSGGNEINVNLKRLCEYKDDCVLTLKNLEKADGIIEHYKGEVDKGEDCIYWSAAAEFGKMYIEMSLSWAEKIIGKLKRKKEGNDESI